MKHLCLTFLFFFLLGCANREAPVQNELGLEITEINPNKWTAITKQNIIHLFQVYNLDPFLYTRKIRIQPKAIPHSHPVLTLNTRYAENPNKLLSTLLHEELHWWAIEQSTNVSRATLELKKIYPQVPKEGMAKDGKSTYLHMIICYLEYLSIIHFLGEKETKRIFEDFIKKDKLYPWVYTQVLYKNYAIKRIIHKYKLVPKSII